METSRLQLNVISLAWPANPITCYVGVQPNTDNAVKLPEAAVPPQMLKALQAAQQYTADAGIYCSFGVETPGYVPVKIALSEHRPFAKYYYSHLLQNYFTAQQVVYRHDFIKQIEVWVQPQKDNEKGLVYFDKFCLKPVWGTNSDCPQLLISYVGSSSVMMQPVSQLIDQVNPDLLSTVYYNKRMYRYEDVANTRADFSKVYPVVNPAIRHSLGWSFPSTNPRQNKYLIYHQKITAFYHTYIDKDVFRALFLFHQTGFTDVKASGIIDARKHLLRFGKGTGDQVFYQLPQLEPYSNIAGQRAQLFYIYPKPYSEQVLQLHDYLSSGYKSYKGFYSFIQLLLHTERNFSIEFTNEHNPIDEIEQALQQRTWKPNTSYIAVYISPHSKTFGEDESHAQQIYYWVKELLLKRGIVSQCIDLQTLLGAKGDLAYSLPNMAIAMFAKLGGQPWQIETTPRKELVVGVGAFRQQSSQIQYIGSAFCFSNTGQFNRFEYFRQHETKMLAGSISRAIREYTQQYTSPQRLIIHFYKTMSKRETAPIEEALHRLGLHIPVYVVTINKTTAADWLLWDSNNTDLMPASGTYLALDKRTYLLCNNTRYAHKPASKKDGFPFPVKLKISSTAKEDLDNELLVQALIEQVYQFSRIYWKSVKQQPLPVTIKYPEMVARIAPHFRDKGLPTAGKDRLWFL